MSKTRFLTRDEARAQLRAEGKSEPEIEHELDFVRFDTEGGMHIELEFSLDPEPPRRKRKGADAMNSRSDQIATKKANKAAAMKARESAYKAARAARYWAMTQLDVVSTAMRFSLDPQRSVRQRLGDAYDGARIAAYAVCGNRSDGAHDSEQRHFEVMFEAAQRLGLSSKWMEETQTQMDLRTRERLAAAEGHTVLSEVEVQNCLRWMRTLHAAALDGIVQGAEWWYRIPEGVWSQA